MEYLSKFIIDLINGVRPNVYWIDKSVQSNGVKGHCDQLTCLSLCMYVKNQAMWYVQMIMQERGERHVKSLWVKDITGFLSKQSTALSGENRVGIFEIKARRDNSIDLCKIDLHALQSNSLGKHPLDIQPVDKGNYHNIPDSNYHTLPIAEEKTDMMLPKKIIAEKNIFTDESGKSQISKEQKQGGSNDQVFHKKGCGKLK